MKFLKYFIGLLVSLIIIVLISTRIPAFQDRFITRAINTLLNSQTELPSDALTAIVCGSSSPIPAPDRAEACILIKAGDSYYIVDSGDGSISNLRNWRINLSNVKGVFLTHLHSDHISDLAHLHQGTWIAQSRSKKLDVYGPKGVSKVTKGFEVAYEIDFKFRNEHHGDKVAPLDIAGYDPHPIDLSNPIIIDENGLKVTAFAVPHDPVKPALGYRFDYRGRSIVISGDTRYSENLINNAQDADVLFHEAQANHILKIMENASKNAGFDQRAKIFTDILSYHTTPEEAADIANKANVDHLVFYHLVPAPRNNLMSKMFVRGVNEIRKDWTISSDGTMVVLPFNSDEIIISSIN